MNRTENEMNRMDDALKNALRRQQPPEGFADRVLVRVAEQHASPRPVAHHSWPRFFTEPIVRWAALATVAAAMIVGVHLYNVRQERARGEAAKQRLMLALHIAGSKLQLARAKVNQINADQPDPRDEKE